VKIQDLKVTNQVSGREIAGRENAKREITERENNGLSSRT